MSSTENTINNTNSSLTTQSFCNFIKNSPDGHGLTLTALHNFLSHSFLPSSELNIEKINTFFSQALHFPFWQQNKLLLFKYTLQALNAFQKNLEIKLDSRNLLDLRHFEVLPVSSSSAFEEFLKDHLKRKDKAIHVRKADQNIYFSLHGELMTGTHQDITLNQFAPILALYKGKVAPLTQNQTLFYNQGLSLQSAQYHSLRIDNNHTVVFHTQKSPYQVNAKLLKGYTFSLADQTTSDEVFKIPYLFTALKRLEKHYIAPKSDPDYKNLCHKIEKTTQELENSSNPEDSFDLHPVLNLIQETQSIINDIYQNDKWLKLLVENLRKTFVIRIQVTKETPTWPKNPPLKRDPLDLLPPPHAGQELVR